ncbi:MAG: biotin--[acetyl-CoA-carboxylase] ligase [Gammaproteobacteria bacterium]|nr:biotin--[acetyl-CoA-carboxylase] ligase [Gammaproteobacteria bacterium]
MPNITMLHPALRHQHFKCIDSTNAYLLQNPQLKNQLISTDEQSAGRGRRQQKWVDEGESLLFSLSLEFPIGIDVTPWALQVALTTIETLIPFTQQRLKIKWPNDLYAQNRNGEYGKFSGILVESTMGQIGRMVTGIGINLAPLKNSIESDYPLSYLQTEENKQHILFSLANELYWAWQSFLEKPQVCPGQFAKHDYLANNMILATNTNNNKQTIGQSSGINHHGQLLVQQHGCLTPLTSQQSIRLL